MACAQKIAFFITPRWHNGNNIPEEITPYDLTPLRPEKGFISSDDQFEYDGEDKADIWDLKSSDRNEQIVIHRIFNAIEYEGITRGIPRGIPRDDKPKN